MATDQGNTPAASKRCSICGETKAREAFGLDKRTRSGLTSECRACKGVRTKAYRLADPNYRSKDALLRAKPSRRELQRLSRARYFAKPENRERDLERRRQWTKDHQEQRRAMKRKHRRADNLNRRALKKASGQKVTAKDLRGVLANSLGICAYCNGAGPLDVDHIESLSRGGQHALDNLTAACKTCNRHKGATPLLLWLARKASLRARSLADMRAA